MTTIELLEAVEHRFAVRDWTRLALARDSQGNPVHEKFGDPVSFCVLGAMCRSNHIVVEIFDASQELMATVVSKGIKPTKRNKVWRELLDKKNWLDAMTVWNDQICKDKDELLGVIRETIQRLSSRELNSVTS